MSEALEHLSDEHLNHLELGLRQLLEAMQYKDEKTDLLPIPGE